MVTSPPSAGSTNTMRSSTRSTATDETPARQDGLAGRIQRDIAKKAAAYFAQDVLQSTLGSGK
jgi:hypothetical protein